MQEKVVVPRSPEKIRDVRLASLLTAVGMVCLAFGLAFAVELSRVTLVIFGISSCLSGPFLWLAKRRRGRG